MKKAAVDEQQEIEAARGAALEVLLHNAHGPFDDLPRTAGWGYAEPYTRDLMISMLGIAVSGNEELMAAMRRVLQTLAHNQSEHGHMPSLVHNQSDRGSSDSTPLFLLATAIYRQVSHEPGFLSAAVRKAMTWMEYQSPADQAMAAQQPTSDWRDEQWVLGNGLFVNSVVHAYLELHGQHARADQLRAEVTRPIAVGGRTASRLPAGLSIPGKPYLALWSYKVYSSRRFDLLGNSLAIISGMVTRERAARIVDWVERQCALLRADGDLSGRLPPNLFPFILPSDPDWLPRYQKFNRPGNYHNGGIWPFVCGFYIAALVAAQRFELAGQKLVLLTRLVQASRRRGLAFGFNEWFSAPDAQPRGQDWQTWSAAMYLYAAQCVEEGRAVFFDGVSPG